MNVLWISLMVLDCIEKLVMMFLLVKFLMNFWI